MNALRTIPVLVLLSRPAIAAPLFDAPYLAFDAGENAIWVASGDLNADGNTDLVVANGSDHPHAGADFVSVLLARGDGTFEPRRSHATEGRASSVAIGDANGDGHMDIVATTRTDHVSVLLGDGAGGFPVRHDLTTGVQPLDVALGDANGDGNLDLAVSYVGASRRGNVALHLGHGNGTFESAWTPHLTIHPTNTRLVDMDRDGNLDIVLASTTGISILRGDGGGGFGIAEESLRGIYVHCVTVADFNADGWPDLAAASNEAGKAFVASLLGIGGGSFAAPSRHESGNDVRFLAAADADGDGWTDLILGNVDRTGLSVLRWEDGAGFQPGIRSSGLGGPRHFTLADFDSDARIDVAVLGSVSERVVVSFGRGDGRFGFDTTLQTSQYPNCVAIRDLNADGVPDLAIASRPLTIHLGSGDGTFGGGQQVPAIPYSREITLADLNADGQIDVVAADEYEGKVSVLHGEGDGTFAALGTWPTGAGPADVDIADLNADGWQDIVTANELANTVSILLGRSAGEFEVRPVVGTGGFPVDIEVTDLNGDAFPDLTVLNSRSTTVSALLGLGDARFLRTFDSRALGDGAAMASGDMNADGRMDLVARGRLTATVSVLLGHGDGLFAQPINYSNVDTNGNVIVHDVDGDGFLDVLAPRRNGSVSVFLGQGDGSLGEEVEYGVGPDPAFVAAGDLDRDGVPDLVVAYGGYWGALRVLHGRGAARASVERTSRSQVMLRSFRVDPSGSLHVRLQLSRPVSRLQIDAYDVRGRLVRALALGAHGAGDHDIAWESAAPGPRLAHGVYFVRLAADDAEDVRKLVLLRAIE